MVLVDWFLLAQKKQKTGTNKTSNCMKNHDRTTKRPNLPSCINKIFQSQKRVMGKKSGQPKRFFMQGNGKLAARKTMGKYGKKALFENKLEKIELKTVLCNISNQTIGHAL